MALSSPYWRLSISWADRQGRVSTYKYRMVKTDTAGDAGDVLDDAVTVVTAFKAASFGTVVAYQVEKVFLEGSAVLPDDGGALNSIVAQITGEIRGQPNESGVFAIPQPLDLVFQAASGESAGQVNFGQSEVDTIVDFFDSSGSNLLKISDGESINANIVKGRRVTRRSQTP